MQTPDLTHLRVRQTEIYIENLIEIYPSWKAVKVLDDAHMHIGNYLIAQLFSFIETNIFY